MTSLEMTSSSASTTFTEDDRLNRETIEPMLHKLYEIMPKLVPHLPRARFLRLSALEEMIRQNLCGILSEEDMELLKLLVSRQELRSTVSLQKKLEEYLTFKHMEGGKHFCKKSPEQIVAFRETKKTELETSAFEEKSEKLSDSSIISLKKCSKCLLSEQSMNKIYKALLKSQETEEKLRTRLLAKDAEKKETEGKLQLVHNRLEDREDELEEWKLKSAADTARLANAQVENRKLGEELDACKDEAMNICQEMLEDLKEARKKEEETGEAFEKKCEELEHMKVQLDEAIVERDLLHASLNDFEQKSSSSGVFEDPFSPSSSTALYSMNDPSVDSFQSSRSVATLCRRRMLTVKLAEYEELRKTMESQKPLDCLDQLLENVVGKCKDESEITKAKKEIADFRKGLGTFMALLEYNIKLMTENPSLKLENLIELPELPTWTSKNFAETYEAALKGKLPGVGKVKKVKKVKKKPTKQPSGDNGCIICFDDIEHRQIVLICPACSEKYHRNCIVDHLQKHPDCPACHAPMRK